MVCFWRYGEYEDMILNQLLMMIGGLLCGSLLFGSFLPRIFKKMDVTELAEDHNPGTANAMKYAGVPVGILCLIGDIFKGVLPIHLALHFGLETGSLFPLVMAAPVFGHAYSLFHHGKGGKAIAVSFGVLIGLLPVNSDLLALLCFLYILNSTLLRINPHTRRTRITFICFTVCATALMLLKRVPTEFWLGVLLLSWVVIHKNSLKQEGKEITAAEEVFN